MNWIPNNEVPYSIYLSNIAVRSLIEEAELTPKPGLVDLSNNGAHPDLTIDLMIKSAKALEETFEKMAFASHGLQPSQLLREEIAAIGRSGELVMFQTTKGVNTHKGAIWALGLLVSAASIHNTTNIEQVVTTAGKLAGYTDRHCPTIHTNGSRVSEKYGVSGAKGEAEQGFPHIIKFSLPILRDSRRKGIPENVARLDALLNLMANLDDTCILHRGGTEALAITKKQAAYIIDIGGASTWRGWQLLQQLDQTLVQLNVSPGGSADLLAATLFLDFLNCCHKGEKFTKVDQSLPYEFIQ